MAACGNRIAKDVGPVDSLAVDSSVVDSLTVDSLATDSVAASEGGEAEKQLIESDINEKIVEKIRAFYEDYVFYGKKDLNIEEAVKKNCTKRLAQQLKESYQYDGEGYAIWDFRGPDWGPGDSDAHKVDDIIPLGDGKYKVEYRDGGQKMSCTVTMVVNGQDILFDDIE